MRSRLFMLAAVACALPVFLSASIARANGRFPASNQLVVAPNDPHLLLLRTTFGVLVSHDQGQNWDWICEQAIGYSGVEDPFLAITANGTFLAGTYEGLATSHDTGCGWAFAGGALANAQVTDLALRPGAPQTAVALVSKSLGIGDAGPTYDTHIFRTDDSGATWNPIGTALDATALPETVDVAPSDPNRLYVSVVHGSGAQATASLLTSLDNGQTWASQAIPIDPNNETAAYIAGVDPTDPTRVYIRTNGPDQERLLVASLAGADAGNGADAGANFQTIFTGGSLLGFALSADGSQVFVGSSVGGFSWSGLWMASKSDYKFSKRASIVTQCLTMSAETLYACSSESSGFILGASTDNGATFKPLLHLTGVRGPLACGAGSSVDQCADQWAALQDLIGEPRDAGGDAAPQTPAHPSTASGGGGCGCSFTAVPIGGGLMIGIALLGLFSRRRRGDIHFPK